MNSDLKQANLIDIFRTLHPKSTEYTFFSAPHHIYSKIDHIMVKGSMQQEELSILNIYAHNIGASRYTKQTLNDLQRGLDSHKIIVGDFNTPLSILGRSMRQKINKDIQDLNSEPDQANLRHLQNSPPQIHRMYILLSTTSHLL